MSARHARQRPRSASHETTGTLSYHEIDSPHDMHALPGNATERLVSGLFTAPPGTSTAGALRRAQRALMDDAQTSHPYYWSGFAIVGDGAAPVIRPAPRVAAAAH